MESKIESIKKRFNRTLDVLEALGLIYRRSIPRGFLLFYKAYADPLLGNRDRL